MCAFNILLEHNVKVGELNNMNAVAFKSLETIFEVMTSSDPNIVSNQTRAKSTRFAYAFLSHQISEMKASFASSVSF